MTKNFFIQRKINTGAKLFLIFLIKTQGQNTDEKFSI